MESIIEIGNRVVCNHDDNVHNGNDSPTDRCKIDFFVGFIFPNDCINKNKSQKRRNDLPITK